MQLTPQTSPTNPAAAPGASDAVRARVTKILELIRPAVQADGGDLELVSISGEGVVQIRLHGACVGCPSSQVTLQTGIEKNLRDHVPEIKRVEAVD